MAQVKPRMGPGMPKAWFSFLGQCTGMASDGREDCCRLRVEVPTLRWALSVPVGNVRELPEYLQQIRDAESGLKPFLEYLNQAPEYCDEIGLSVFITFITPTLKQCSEAWEEVQAGTCGSKCSLVTLSQLIQNPELSLPGHHLGRLENSAKTK